MIAGNHAKRVLAYFDQILPARPPTNAKECNAIARQLTFAKGWADRLNGKAYPAGYFLLHVPPLAYERGRHAAALYAYDCESHGRRTINVPYGKARKTMSKSLRKLIDEERRWCALRPKKNKLFGA